MAWSLMGKRVHVSWLIAAFFGSVIVGIAVAALVDVSFFTAVPWLVLASLLLIVSLVKQNILSVFLIVLGGVCIGLFRGGHEQTGLEQYQVYIGKTVVVRGFVSEDVGYAAGDTQRIKLKNIVINDKPLNGQIWVSTQSNITVKRSDVITIRGFMIEGFGTFAATLTRARIITVERPDYADVARDVRDDFATAVRRGIAEPQASLGVGFLTGQRSTLPPDLDEQLKIVGLTHVVVASGYNLTILVRFARRGFAKISKYLATAAAGTMIVGFVLVTGWSPSMSRAGLVAGLSLLAWYYGRTIHPVVLLLSAAGVTALFNPGFVWGDIGWYLSFAAFAGVIMLAPLVHHFFWGDPNEEGKKPRILRQIFIDTSCAQIATLPIMAFAFGQYSLYALPANLLVLALIPLVMLLTFFTGLAGLIVPAIATVIGWPAQVLLNYMTSVVSWIANQPGAQGSITLNIIMLTVSYFVLLATAFVLVRKTNHTFRKDSLIE